MIDDRNKSDLTKQVTAAALMYLDERGCKPIETEVGVASGWVADIAAVLDPTITELVALKLLKRQPRYGCPGYKEWDTQVRQVHRFMTALVEVKVSRSDFSGDQKWTLPLPTNLAYLAFPKGLITESEYPAGWGLLEYSIETDCVRCRRRGFCRALRTL